MDQETAATGTKNVGKLLLLTDRPQGATGHHVGQGKGVLGGSGGRGRQRHRKLSLWSLWEGRVDAE